MHQSGNKVMRSVGCFQQNKVSRALQDASDGEREGPSERT